MSVSFIKLRAGLFGILFTLTSCCALAGQEADTNGENQWRGFGSQSGWNSELALEGKSYLRLEWEARVQDGRNQIVGAGSKVFVTSGSSRKDENEQLFAVTKVMALSLESGEQLWSLETESLASKGQETFGGNPIAPQATPLLIQDRLILVTFTGRLICVDSNSGQELWELDTIKDLGAEPVQFGFSSSPVAAANGRDFLLSCAGPSGGLFKLDAEDGKVIWRNPQQTSSYATPVEANYGGVRQWIVVSNSAVTGVSAADGETLWQFDWPEAGLTNVPSPLVVDEQRLLLSGQGCQGTLCIQVSKKGEQWSAEEAWANRRTQLFYTNWLMLDERIAIGCTDSYLTAFDCLSGKQLGRWRGYADGNLLRVADGLLALTGKGQLAVLNRTAQGFKEQQRFEVIDGRCWAAPSIIGDRILARSGERLVCLRFTADESPEEGRLVPMLKQNRRPDIKFAGPESSADPVLQVVDAFEKNGIESAMATFAQLHQQKKFVEEQYIQLATAAFERNLKSNAITMLELGQKAFPDSKQIADMLKKWRE